MSFQCPNRYPDCCKSDRTTSYSTSIFIILNDQWNSYLNCMLAHRLYVRFKQLTCILLENVMRPNYLT